MICARLENLKMNYGSGDVLKGIDLSIPKKKIVALLGINGAGKSTLMQILAGHLKPTSGRCELLGSVAMVHQELSLVLDLSIAENFALGKLKDYRRLGHINWKQVYKDSVEALSILGLKLDPKNQVRFLSTGEAQLVEIARALSLKPSLLILDEPTSALSHQETKTLFSILRNLVKNSTTSILFVSHRLDEVRELSEQVIILKDGMVKAILEQNEIDASRIIELMTGTTAEQHTSNATTISTASKSSPVLKAKQLCVTDRKTKRTIFNLDHEFCVYPGQMVGLAGLLGSGRSIFLRALSSKLRLASGGVRTPTDDLKIKGRVKGTSIAYLHEDRKQAGLFPELSALENIAIAEHRTNSKRRASELFHTVGVVNALHHMKAKDLSGGNQQKLLLGRALLSCPKLLLLDEPTRGVDAAARLEIYRLLNDFRRDGGSVVWISSDFDELLKHSTDLYLIHRGRLEHLAHRPETEAQLTSIVLQSEKQNAFTH